MKNIQKKFEINSSTYFFVLLYFLCGFIKNILIIYFIVLIHEMGHIAMSLISGYKIKKITIFPFGGITETNVLLNSSLKKDFMVFNGGFLFQIILQVIIFILHKNFAAIDLNFYNLFSKYNLFILFFNLIPIIPLDGYLILNNIFNILFSYLTSLWISLFLSIISLCLFVYYYRSNQIIIIFLIFNIINYLKNIDVLYNRFILERYLYKLPFYKIKYYQDSNLKKIKRETLCYFKIENTYQSEKELLNKKFDNNKRIW